MRNEKINAKQVANWPNKRTARRRPSGIVFTQWDLTKVWEVEWTAPGDTPKPKEAHDLCFVGLGGRGVLGNAREEQCGQQGTARYCPTASRE